MGRPKRPLKNDCIHVNGYLCHVVGARSRSWLRVESGEDVPLPSEMAIDRDDVHWNDLRQAWEATYVGEGQGILGEDAQPGCSQHSKPCGDCPWSRRSVPGWLGAMRPVEWLQAAHGEATADCHGVQGAQCAGMAIYRANVAKSPRNPEALRLGADRERVFANRTEFMEHHRVERIAEAIKEAPNGPSRS